MNLSGYWHSCTLWHCSHGTDPRREDNQSHKGTEMSSGAWATQDSPIPPRPSDSFSTSNLGSQIPAAM